MHRNYLMIRAMRSTERDFQLFFTKSVVAIGFSKVDFTACPTVEVLRQQIFEQYYRHEPVAPQVRSKKVNEAVRFAAIQAGDALLIPHYSAVCLATAKERSGYDANVATTLDLANQREVDYQRLHGQRRLVPRTALSEGLQRRLRVRGSTVADLTEFSEEIEHLFSHPDVNLEVRAAAQEERLRTTLKRALLRNIQSGKTYLPTGGRGLEELVRELLECKKEGYRAHVLAKQTFKGSTADADIYAVKADRFGEHQLLIQVKHHRGTTDAWGLHQLQQIKNTSEYARYEDCTKVLLTSGELEESVRRDCEAANVQAMDGHELVEWILDCADQLSPQTKTRLGISSVPTLLFSSSTSEAHS